MLFDALMFFGPNEDRPAFLLEDQPPFPPIPIFLAFFVFSLYSFCIFLHLSANYLHIR